MVRDATSSKSCALRIVLRSGFSWSWSSVVAVGGGLTQSSVMVAVSTWPLYLSGERFVGRTEGAWIEL